MIRYLILTIALIFCAVPATAKPMIFGISSANVYGAIATHTQEADPHTGYMLKAVPTNSKAAAYTVGTDNANECYGGIIYVTSAAVITACDGLTTGMNFTVITVGAIAVSVDPQDDDLIVLDGTALTDGQAITNTSTAGDIAACSYYDATGWHCSTNSWVGP